MIRLPLATDTHRLGVAIGAELHPEDLVILDGALGAGKTTLTKGIAVGMGITDTIMSPTFVIARVHRNPTGTTLVHVDAYRLGDALELDDLDLDTDLAAAAIVIEWGVGRAEQLAAEHLVIRLERHPDDTRTAELIGTGETWQQRARAIVAAFADL